MRRAACGVRRLARGGLAAHGREVLGVAQVEGAARRTGLQRRAQLARALRLCHPQRVSAAQRARVTVASGERRRCAGTIR